MKLLYALISFPWEFQRSSLYQELGIQVEYFDTPRNLHRALKRQVPDYFVGEFVYGWGNNYAGANVSNLDVTLRTMQAAAPKTRVIIVMQASEEAHIGKLLDLFSVHAVLKYPVDEAEMRVALG